MNPFENQLWAPWRMEYIKREMNDNSDDCFLCDKPKADDDEESLLLIRGELSFVLMNLYPYNNAHLIVSPYSHISDYTKLSAQERSECQELLAGSMTILENHLNPEGFNVGLNLGKAGGAGLEDHIHWHLVPRWFGDTNFMPVLGHTKVIMDGLKDTYRKLKPDFEKLKDSLTRLS